GDDSVWAEQKFDDSNWDTIKTRLPVSNTPENFWKGIGWFKTNIRIDSSLINQPLAFLIDQFGASEIYLNGKLIKKLGAIGNTSEQETPYQPSNIPFTVILDTNLVYNIAVRYSNQLAYEKPEWYSSRFGLIGFMLSLRDNDEAITSKVDNEKANVAVNILISGIFLALSLLYFALFIFYSDKKENIYYALFNFCIAILFAVSQLERAVKSDLGLIVFYNILSSASLTLVFIFYLGFLYSIFYTKIPKLFYIITAIALAFIISDVLGFKGDLPDRIQLGFIALTTLIGLFIIIQAIRKKKEHAWIIGTGVILFVIFVMTLFVVGLLGQNISSVVGIILFFIGLVSLPMTMSIYLARSIATTNKNLQKQIIAVKELSQKELEQKLRAQKAEAENERKSKELEEARQLQLSMLPKELPNLPHLDIAVYMKTATEVGGDYYDFHVGMDGTLTVVIGDATGHGLKAGTMVTTAKSLFSSHAHDDDIIKTFHEFTRVIKNMRMHLMSMCLSIIKINGDNLKISAAGMPPALLYRKVENRVEELVIKGMPLGAFTDFPYKLHETKLQKGDTLFLLSDGLPELFDKEKNMFGYENVTKEFSKVADRSPEEIIQHMNKTESDWIGNSEPDDDVTFVVIKVK
ncbi:MAG: SpoIIE family protein phosphatase, partial [Ignavibacteriaceae bacterium]|nr:SpoIIE family protein phosphatase [Ignavibacteriaceae bacterium]